MAKHLSDRRESVAAWLDANGIPPGDVPIDADITIEDSHEAGRVIHCETFDRTSDGHIQIDDTGKKAATKFVTVPLKTNPPPWWRSRVKPTRDELLRIIEELRHLGPALELEATAPGMHDAAREAKRDASRRIREILPGPVEGP